MVHATRLPLNNLSYGINFKEFSPSVLLLIRTMVRRSKGTVLVMVIQMRNEPIKNVITAIMIIQSRFITGSLFSSPAGGNAYSLTPYPYKAHSETRTCESKMNIYKYYNRASRGILFLPCLLLF